MFEVVSAFGFFNGWRIRWPCFQTLSTVGSAPSRIHLLNFEKADLSRFRSIESGGRERNRASAIAWRRPVTYWWTRWCLTTTSWAEARVAVVAIFVIFGPRFINQHDLIGIDVRHGIRSSVTSGRDIRTGHPDGTSGRDIRAIVPLVFLTAFLTPCGLTHGRCFQCDRTRLMTLLLDPPDPRLGHFKPHPQSRVFPRFDDGV